MLKKTIASSVEESTLDERAHVDVLPDDLDVTKHVGPYQFPSPRKRKTAAEIGRASCRERV